MSDAEYILLKRKKRLWPAKVLSRGCASQTRQACKGAATYCLVEILGLNEQARVHCKSVELLTEESIECIAANLGQSRKDHDKMEEITYRRALREALDILQQTAQSKERSPSKATKSKAATRKETEGHVAGHWPRSSQNDMQKREREAAAALQIMGAPNKCCNRSRGKPKESPSAKLPGSKSRVLLRNGELKGQPRRAAKAKTPVTPKKEVTLKPLSGPVASRRSPRFSKVGERHPQEEAGRERSSSPPPSKCFARTSTPTRSSPNFAKLTPGRKLGGELGLRRSLLGSPIKCPSAEAEKGPAEEEELPPRKYSKDRDGERHPQDLKGQKQTPAVSSLCQERRGASLHEGSAGSPDPVGAVLDGIRKENLYPWAEEAKNFQLCDWEGKAGFESPLEAARRLSPTGELCLSSAFVDEEAADDEEELPSILLHQEPCSMEAGMLVWCKFSRYPYWPAVVKSVKQKAKKASIQFVEKHMNDKKSKGLFVSLRNLKHFDCEEKQMLIDKAREGHWDEINWCINLITDYRIRVGCHSFTGTLLEYCADDMSYPVRKETYHDLSQMISPQIEEVNSEEPPPEATPPKPTKKVLPDRTRAARDRANKKIVEFIVKAKGAHEHLRAILESKKQSLWLNKFLKAPPSVTSIETYLEDENQLDLVVKYLQEVYREVDAELLPLINGDSVKFILDVLFPEAIIYAISAVDRIDYKKAEEKYMRGPLLGQREKEIFEENLRKEKEARPAAADPLS
ncbi:PWWP domain-containing DNA repair factor 3A [Heteronotia binoei]|uniref:PWWP domain-containing DNA repair factor 3A n=1 Tax=Heteronotia binoei TaxID=13085 RepID=UPI0029318665|nr:PWWP domain-containing DNA repair factor 3A [Heteronotia binoei]